MRKKGSKDVRKRAKRRTAYETYSYWYDKYTKGDKAKLFSRKYTEEEFKKKYENALKAKVDNPAMQVARKQGVVLPVEAKKLIESMRDVYGEVLELDEPEKRRIWFVDFYDQMRLEGMMDHDEIEKQFQELFY